MSGSTRAESSTKEAAGEDSGTLRLSAMPENDLRPILSLSGAEAGEILSMTAYRR